MINNNLFNDEANKNNIQEEINFEEQENIDFSLRKTIEIIIRRRRYFIFGTLSSFLLIFAGFTYQRISKPVYQGYFSLLIKDPIDKGNQQSNLGSSSSVFDQLARNTVNNDIPTLIEFLKSPVVLGKIAEKLNISKSFLSKNVNIKIAEPEKRSLRAPAGVLNVFLNYRNRKEGLNILKEISESYLQASLEQRQKRLSDGIKFLDAEAPALEKNTLNLQNQLANFRKEYKLIDPSIDAMALKERLTILENNLFKLNVEKGRLETIKNQIKEGNLISSGFKLSVSNSTNSISDAKDGFSITDPNQSSLDELYNLKSQYADSLTKFLPNSSVVLGIKEKIETLEPIVLENQLKAVNAAIDLNEGLILSSENQRKELNKFFLKLPKLISEYQSIEQKLLLALEQKKGLANVRENFRLEIAQRNVPWQIIDGPLFGKNPIYPSITKYLFYGLFLSILIGIILALLRDKFDNVFHSSDEVKNSVKLSFLGEIRYLSIFARDRIEQKSILQSLTLTNLSQLNKSIDLKISMKDIFFFQESLKNLFTSIKFLVIDNNPKIIAISSSIPGEGKTLINILTAKTISDVNKKVLLIDADLRKPQVHKRLNKNNITGLSNFLIDQSLDFDQVVQKVAPKWDIITAGQVVPDPSKVFSSKRFGNLFEIIKKSNRYDYVIIDSPPILGLSDSYYIASESDALVLVVSIENVKKDLLKECIQSITNKNIKISGFITNSKKKSNSTNLIQADYSDYLTDYYYDEKKDEPNSAKESKKSSFFDNTYMKKFNYLKINLEKKLKSLLNWLDK